MSNISPCERLSCAATHILSGTIKGISKNEQFTNYRMCYSHLVAHFPPSNELLTYEILQKKHKEH